MEKKYTVIMITKCIIFNNKLKVRLLETSIILTLIDRVDVCLSGVRVIRESVIEIIILYSILTCLKNHIR